MPDTNQTDYILKLKALFHDPIHKIWAMSNKDNLEFKNINEIKATDSHEKVAEDLFRFILSENLKVDNISIADKIAAAVSRIIVAPNIQDAEKRKNFNEDSAVFLENVKYIDPFSGNLIVIGSPQNHDEVKNIFKKLGELSFSNEQERAKLSFLFLWRFLPEIFPWINTHPADSRTPNHSIYDHLVQTSAIATSLQFDKPSFLLFTLTPVQSFIATARKTSDLWAGSYLLSYLIFKAIEVVIEKYGPDHIIFPNLLGQPLVDKWLKDRQEMNEEKLNNFKDNNWFKDYNLNSNYFDKITIANFPNRFLAIVPYNESKGIAKECKNAIENTVNEFLNKIPKELKEILSSHNDKIKDNIFSYLKIYWVVLPWYKENYSDVDTIINEYKNLIGENELLEVIKIIKDHHYYGNANVGNAYSLLVELTERFLASRKMIKDFVVIEPQTGEKCHLCGENDILPLNNNWNLLVSNHYVSETEKLCGVCLFKRLLPDIMTKELDLSEKVQFPSTSEMATVKYKSKISTNTIDSFVKKYNEIFNHNLPEIKSVPALKNHKLYSIDGQWLMKSSYRKDYLKKEFGIELEENKIKEMKKFLKEQKIDPPVYYAILAMDGDNMGKWLKGEFLPKIGNLIHDKAKESLVFYSEGEDRKKLEKLINSKHPMSPSFHNLFSRKLSDFALSKVREIVEGRYYGKLIYAGGDDILAFLPVEDALDCACELNNEFKMLLSNNLNASMSAGIVFVHHKYPLELALNEVREAEKKAKKKYGKSTFCIKYVTGGGYDRYFGMKWDDKDFFNDVVCRYETDELSTKFAYDFMNVVNSVYDSNGQNNENVKNILKNELLRIYAHKKSNKKDKDFEQQMLQHFDKMKPEDFTNMFVIARFVAGVKSKN
ncbi:MAG: type III-B CRISPR-associated protein Cas10/Cmr2 [Spirochaetales bacterium]|nr:type III-B CRISPR-associated protein Cas10/Cmr2 [Spirochaetales bacterium]